MANLNLHHLRLFRATAREGTLTAAARALNISQSAVSTQIKALEADLGHDLFERRGRNLVLTEAGRIALDYAEQIFRASEQLTATFRAVGGQRKVLRIGALATLSRNFQMGFLAPLLGRDDVEVVLRSGTQVALLQALDALRIDVLLPTPGPARVAARPFLGGRMAAQRLSVGGTRARLALAAQGLPALLSRAPLILPTPETALRAGFDALIETLGIVPRIAAEADDMAMLRLLARSDAGVAVIPPIVVRDELAGGALYELAQLPGLTEEFHAVTIARTFPNPLLREVLGPGGSEAGLAADVGGQ
ncbi:MAG: LysR family transcriptional regulator [Erythrobacter sp.]